MPRFRAKTEHIYIQGKVAWLRNKQPNQWNKWAVQVHPNPKSLDLLRDLQAQGMKNVIKKDEDGYYINLSRPVSKQTRTGTTMAFTPPELFDKDGNPYDGPVGNGSDATLKCEVYEFEVPAGGRAKAIRWASARIDNLVEYNKDRDMDDFQKKAAFGLQEQPEQIF